MALDIPVLETGRLVLRAPEPEDFRPPALRRLTGRLGPGTTAGALDATQA